MRNLQRKKWSGQRKFHKAKLTQSSRALSNPGCGWYHLYTFYAEHPVQNFYLADETEELVLLRIDIGAFQKNRLSQEALDYITRILTFFQSREKGIILRIAYDTQGQGLLREPESSALIKIHMRQLGEVLLPFAQDILVFQGILVGSWGEMHNSRFLSERWLRELAQTMLEALQYQCTLAVRKPSQWRAIVRDSPKILQERLALFNDGIFGSETDLGTYGTVSRAQVWETDSWLREEELEWQQITLQKQTNGGEMPGTAPWEKAAADFAKMHLCYLNSTYSPEALEIWKNTKVFWKACKEELSAYDYIGRHLGYRFVVQKLQWKNERLYITVENCGFANLCQEAQCRLLLVSSRLGQRFLYPKTEPMDWNSQSCTTFSVSLPAEEREEGTRCFLQLQRKSDGRNLLFANADSENGVLLGQFGKVC